MTKYKGYFVIMQQHEIETLSSESEIAVYRSIKSQCSNGKSTACLSYRDIQNRTKLSFGTVHTSVRKLLNCGYISIVGTDTGLGGTSNIYKCSMADHLKSIKCSTTDHLTKKSDQLLKESDQPLIESDQSVGTETYKVKSNKVNRIFNQFLKSLTAEELYAISLKLNIHISHVRNKHKVILDKQAHSELKRPYKNMARTLTNWLRGDLSRGYLSEMNDVEKLDNATEEPQRKARFMKQIEKWEGEDCAN